MQHPYRVVVADPALDDRGRPSAPIARALRNAGFEVIDAGSTSSPALVAETVLQEDADAVAVLGTPDATRAAASAVVDELASRRLDDVVVFAGALADDDAPERTTTNEAAPFRVFDLDAPASDLIDWLTAALEGRN